jgi:hypothetical protein
MTATSKQINTLNLKIQDVKIVYISTINGERFQSKINDREKTNKNSKLYRAVKKFKDGYQPSKKFGKE